MEELEKRLGYSFQNRQLLEDALRHSSYANESRNRSATSNERLEFLGDAVLGMVVADHLYRKYPNQPEGELTRIRAALVCEDNLVLVARELSLGDYLKLGRGEENAGGRHRPSIQADAVEAVIAAVYLDGGIAAARNIIRKFILNRNQGQLPATRDYKTTLQEFVQQKEGQDLNYRLVKESGPDHDKRFTIEVSLNGQVLGRGEGRSKKEAEQMAAKEALEQLRE